MSSVSFYNYQLQSAEEGETNKDLIFKLNCQFCLLSFAKLEQTTVYEQK